MRVLVVNTATPFVRGGDEALAANLVRQLNHTAGIRSELVRLPFKAFPVERLIDEMLISQSIQLQNVDKIIGLKFPAYLIPHEHKTVWLMHPFRQAYDLGNGGRGLSDSGREGEIKAAVRAADNACFAKCEAIYTTSRFAQARLKLSNGTSGHVLYPPLNDAALFTGGAYGDYIFAGGWVGPSQRQHLLIEAMALAPHVGKLLICGPGQSGAYNLRLRARIARLGLQHRVELRLGHHSRETIAEWINGSLACAYIPYDDSSPGCGCMEAHAAAKAVLTTADAGGILEIVNHETGMITAPSAEALAKSLAEIWENRKRTADLGLAAQSAWGRRKQDWASTILTLLS